MPRSDDSNGVPPGRLRRPHPQQKAREWAAEDGAARDWRYPDPAERYSHGHDSHGHDSYATPPARDPFADEWQSEPVRDDGLGTPGGFDSADREPSWSDQHDPFDWDAPDPPAEAGWRPTPYRDETPDDDGDLFAGRDPWAAQDNPFQPARPAPSEQPASARDDSLFRRIDGSVQEPDLSALTRRAAPSSGRFAMDDGHDPSELRDRFFSRTSDFDEPATATHSNPPRGNIFDFEAHRNEARQTEADDPYSWDTFEDEPVMPAPEAAAPAHEDPYAEDYDPYDPYAEEPHHQADEDADFLDDEADVYDEPVQQPKSRRKLMVAGVLVAAVATGGTAAYLYKSFQDGSIGSGDAPTLFADDGPVKSEPSDPGGREFPDGNKQIYDRLTGDPVEPVEDAQAGGGDDAGTTAIPGIVTTGAQATADTLDERIAAALRRSSGETMDDGSTAAPADPNSPRPVRTLTVRPDGSVVPSQVATRTAPENMPDDSQTVTTAGIVATTGTGAQTTSAPAAGATVSQAESAPEAASPAPPPEPRPEETRVASAEPATTSSTQPVTTAANPYFVQIAARRDQTSALAAFADLQQKYPTILDGLAPTIKRADLGDKGIWYRLWVGPMDTRGNAQDVCEQLKQAGLGGCFVRTE